MIYYPLSYLPSGHIYMNPDDDCDKVVDALLKTGYSEEFCLSCDFSEDFVGRLMESGFLVMSMKYPDDSKKDLQLVPFYLLLPKLHLTRSVLFFPKLHTKKSIRPHLPLYELRIDTDFDFILEKCVQIHGENWLTPPFIEILKRMRHTPTRVKLVSFALYRDGELKAGEIGAAVGRVYTSYTGYYEEKNSGTVQLIKMAQWLHKTGFDFLDLGMPLDYKTGLGAQNIEPGHFVELFRTARIG